MQCFEIYVACVNRHKIIDFFICFHVFIESSLNLNFPMCFYWAFQIDFSGIRIRWYFLLGLTDNESFAKKSYMSRSIFNPTPGFEPGPPGLEPGILTTGLYGSNIKEFPFISNWKVDQREVVGIDSAHLAMDTEEGVEVVWNEVQFSERRNFKAQEEKIQLVFENLTQLEHPNIVKFHRYWTDTHCEKPRVSWLKMLNNAWYS